MEWKHPDYYKKIKKDFYEKAKKEQKELDESYKESSKQTKERKNFFYFFIIIWVFPFHYLSLLVIIC